MSEQWGNASRLQSCTLVKTMPDQIANNSRVSQRDRNCSPKEEGHAWAVRSQSKNIQKLGMISLSNEICRRQTSDSRPG